MIFRRGPVAHSVLQLVSDLRLLFSPHSSQRLQERKTNTLQDFLAVAPQLQVTHFLCLTQSEVGVNLRVIRIPQGPTLTFRVVSYSLMRDVAKAQKRPRSAGKELEHPPLVVLNGFSAQAAAAAGDVPKPSSDVSLHLPLLSTVLQHMFPPLHLPTLRLAHCRRVVLFHFDPATQLIDVRHYLITAKPTNLSRTVRHILKGQLDDLSHYTDVADYVRAMEGGKAGAMTSDSEGEVGEEAQVELGDRFVGRGNVRGQRSGVRLKEVGPRLTLSLLKAEDDFCGGRVLYHHYLSKSEEEVAELKRRKEERRREREKRKREQERNVKSKRGEEEEAEGDEGEGEGEYGGDQGGDGGEEDDDEAWYEREVGHKPTAGLFVRKEDKADWKEERQATAGKKRRAEGEGEEGKEGGEEGEQRKKRKGGRRVGAGPRQPWIRGRGGKLGDGGRGGAGRGRGGRGRRGR